MENTKSVVIASPRSSDSPLSESESLFSSVLFDISQQVQGTMEGMLKLTSEVDQSTSEIAEEIRKCKEYGESKQKILEEEKERVQKAAYAVLAMLHA